MTQEQIKQIEMASGTISKGASFGVVSPDNWFFQGTTFSFFISVEKKAIKQSDGNWWLTKELIIEIFRIMGWV